MTMYLLKIQKSKTSRPEFSLSMDEFAQMLFHNAVNQEWCCTMIPLDSSSSSRIYRDAMGGESYTPAWGKVEHAR